MDEGPRFFTVEEANELVSALEIEFGRIARARAMRPNSIWSVGTRAFASSSVKNRGPSSMGGNLVMSVL